MLPVAHPGYLVDVVINVEGDRHARLRLASSEESLPDLLTRWGASTSAMTESRTLDPSELFVSRRQSRFRGTAITVAMKVHAHSSPRCRRLSTR